MQTDIDKIESYFGQQPKVIREKFTKYYEILLVFNAKVNLVSTATAPFAAKQHFSDSVGGLEICFAHKEGGPLAGDVYDFGSGNGFPGLVAAILRPDLKIHLVERDLRKAEFMKHVAGELGLKNVTTLPTSIEKLPKDSISCGITRALGSLPTLLIQMNTLFKKDGRLFHFKSDTWTSELANCPTQVFNHWDIQPIGQYTLPESTIDRFIVLTTKIHS
ncbi:MAG: 16S rRNA (guanine(527)-N(7))-methyltransferase RsmG [Bdellovibrionaceae bacterium]|nr:16S rRNA (guanine(527)-N(7))-methyltransferase RsmG [Pseudobdellovibrionaceae bacterium]